jgi:prolyl oligopeptidase
VLLVAGLAAALSSCTPAPVFDPGRYPAAARAPAVDLMHGIEVADPYRWLEDEQSGESQAWVDQQNELTERTLGRFSKVRRDIAAELEAVYGVDAVSNLYPYENRYFLMKREGLEPHQKILVCEGDYRTAPRVVLDPNAFSADGTVALDWWFPSPDGSLIAYGKSASGSV